MHTESESGLTLLYDGVCGLCNHAVQTVIRHDRRNVMRFAALQSSFGSAALERHPALRDVDSVILLETFADGSERVFIRSTAALRVAEYLGGVWSFALIARVIPTPVRDFFYDLIARYRYRFFGKYESCLVPSPEIRARFL
jgi:predicted DCC family thiol-disulfide oxidoreductase YuxK